MFLNFARGGGEQRSSVSRSVSRSRFHRNPGTRRRQKILRVNETNGITFGATEFDTWPFIYVT
jgi:hypothetical protein